MVLASLVLEGKELASGCLNLGNPIRKLRSLNDEEIGHFMCSANHYIQLKISVWPNRLREILNHHTPMRII